MWTTSRTLNANVNPRPGRIAYLVPKAPSHKLLDVLFEECLARWGGRRTPIIPTDGKTISATYWSLLDLWDADIIYSYVRLSDELEARLFHLFAPSETKHHNIPLEDENPHSLCPDYEGNYSFLSSLSLLPIFSRRNQMEGQELPLIADDVYYQVRATDLSDSFGFVLRSCVGANLLPHARRLSICKPNENIANSFREPAEITYLDDESALIEQLSKNRGLLSLTLLSDMFCPYLNHLANGRQAWDDHMTIVIGDQTDDRLLFWYAQHRYKALDSQSDVPVLRLSPKRFKDGPPDWLQDWISRRNHRHFRGNSAPRTILRSCSIAQKDLDPLARSLQGERMVMVSAEHHADPCLFDECEIHTSEKRSGVNAQFHSIWRQPRTDQQSTVRFKSNSFEVPLTRPWHLQFASLSGLTAGIWGIDLTIERCENHAPMSTHVWKFPRRLRTEQAIVFENYNTGIRSLVLPPNLRPTKGGDLTIWDGLSWSRPTLQLPSDYRAFGRPLTNFTAGSPEDKIAIDAESHRAPFSGMSISDKGRDLLGVFQLFANLPEALSFLTDPFWLKVIKDLSPEEPGESKNSIKILATDIAELVKKKRKQERDYEDLAKRALQLAGRSFAAQSQQLKAANFETLLHWAKENSENKSQIKRPLEESVRYLRDRGFLWQGHRWRCSFCQHYNWVALEQLTPISECEICRKPKSSPVSRSLDFRLNPFVHHAFASTSAQGSVIWCLNQLAKRAHSSFAWSPAIDLYRPGETEPELDLDIVAAVDGKVYMVEVKKSFKGVNEGILAKLEELAIKLRPDVAMLAVMADETKCPDELGNLFNDCRNRLGKKDVRFELLTKDKNDAERKEIALPIGEKMTWSAW